MNWETLLAFGDSITYGARSYLGYPEICGSILEQNLEKDWHVINHSSNGFTTIDLTRSISKEMTNYKEIYPSIITVLIGTNDIKVNTKVDDFSIAYKQLIVKMRLLSVRNNIILLKIPRLTKNVFYPYHFSMNEKVNIFNAEIDKLATQNNIRTLEMEFVDNDFFDGVHFNSKGSKSAAVQIAQFILKDKGYEGSPNLS
jgi:lysophospholipase L1-like esterase